MCRALCACSVIIILSIRRLILDFFSAFDPLDQKVIDPGTNEHTTRPSPPQRATSAKLITVCLPLRRGLLRRQYVFVVRTILLWVMRTN